MDVFPNYAADATICSAPVAQAKYNAFKEEYETDPRFQFSVAGYFIYLEF